MNNLIFLFVEDVSISYLLFMVLVMIVSIYFTRWVFGIPTIIANLRVQTVNLKIMRRVVSEMAERQGISKEDIDRITQQSIDEVNAPKDKL